MNLKSKITVISFIMASLCALGAQAGSGGYIVGGKPVPAKNIIAKSTVALVMVGSAGESQASEVSLCTGSIVSDNMIVTAAHCVATQPSSIHIVFGTRLSPANLKSSIVAASFRAHPGYNPDRTTPDQNDVGVVFFKGGLPSGYEPAELLPNAMKLTKSEVSEIAGYGITDAETKAGAGTLRETSVVIENPELGKTEVVMDQTQGHGACHGDSGGPAFIEESGHAYLWGITSRGYPNNSPDDCAHGVVYTKIDSQLEFLESALKEFRP